jgi:hypothetical protein
MYDSIQEGIEKTARSVRYTEAKPPGNLSALVHCYWELKTENTLSDDFHLHALPGACVNILFNQIDMNSAGVTALRTASEVLNLGKTFHYAGIQFLPSVWQGSQDEIVDHDVGTPYPGHLPLIETSSKLARLDFSAKQPVLSEPAQWFIDKGLVVTNLVTEKMLIL